MGLKCVMTDFLIETASPSAYYLHVNVWKGEILMFISSVFKLFRLYGK